MSEAKIKRYLVFVASVAVAIAVINSAARRFPAVGQITQGF